MVVYVLDVNGNPMMPTSRFGKVRRLLKDKKAKVIRRNPFTIKLLYSSFVNKSWKSYPVRSVEVRSAVSIIYLKAVSDTILFLQKNGFKFLGRVQIL